MVRKVRPSTSSWAALSLLESIDGVHALVSDLGVPGGGLELLVRVREQW